MAYNASLASFMESQGIPYAGGLATLPAAQETSMAAQASTAASAAPSYADLVTQAYSNIGRTGFGEAPSAIDRPGYEYWTGQLQSGALTPQSFQQAFGYAAAPALVEKTYQDVLGKAAKDIGVEGRNYWIEQLRTGALAPEQIAPTLAQAAIPVAKSLEDRLALQKFLGKDIYAPEAYLKGTSGMGYQDIVDYANLNVQDPVKFVQFAAKYGIDPSELLAAKKAVSGQDIPTLKTIEDYYAQGKAGLGTRIEDIIKSTIGGVNTGPTVESLYQNVLGRNPTQAEIEPWKQQFGSEIDQTEIDAFVKAAQAERPGAKYNRPLTTAELINVIEGTLPTTATKLSTFTPEYFATTRLEDIEKLISESSANKLQEADRVRDIFTDVYGMSGGDALKLAKDLYQGKDTDDFYEKIYRDLLTKGFNKEVQNEVLLNAAKTNPNSQYFKDNPNAYLAYSPLEKKTGSSGQYGYLNNAPILNANFADNKLGDKNQVIPHLGQDSDFGWMTNSRYTETIARGPAIFGIDFNNRNDIEKAIDFERRIKDGTLIYDSEGGYYDTIKNISINPPKSDNERKNYNPYSSDTLATLQDAARKAGLNPASYRSAGDLFDALEKKTENIYQVVGRAIDWDPNVAKNLGITQTTSGRGGVNQANVLYEKIGDKLVPLQAKAFEFHDPNTTRGFLGDIAGGIASIPFVAEIASAATGGNPLVYAALKGAQTMALGGDLDDALKSAGLAYLTSSFIPKNITPNVSMALATNPLVQQLSTIDTRLANFIIDGGTRAVISSGLAAITGQDPEKAALSALVQSGLGTMTNEGLRLTNIPEQYRGIVSNIISSTILGKDPSKSLAGAATNILKNELKDFAKENAVSDQDRDRTKETKI